MSNLQNAPKYFLVVTLNHKTISLEQLQQFTFTQDQLNTLVKNLFHEESVAEIAGLCTCNRTEIYAGVHSVKDSAHAIAHALSNESGISLEQLSPALNVIVDAESVEHLLKITSGLESMVIGDAQIMGQVKEAYHTAQKMGTVGKTFHTLFQNAFSTAKRVRNETGLGKGRLSIAALAVEYATDFYGSLHEKVATVIGAGKMGRLTAKYLQDSGVKELRIANRSPENSIALANDTGGYVYGLDELNRLMIESDVIISVTASPEPLIRKEQIQLAASYEKKQRLLIDIALPADIDPRTGEVEEVTRIDLEDLRHQALQNEQKRTEQFTRAQEIVEEELDRIGPWPMPLHVDSIAAMMGRYAKSVYEEEITEIFEELPDLTPRQKEIIETKMKKLAERMILMPRRNLRQHRTARTCPNMYECLSELFALEIGARTQDPN